MKRTISVFLALTLALGLFGCAKKPAQTTEPGENGAAGAAAGAEPAGTQDTVNWRYEVTTERTEDSFSNDGGVELATVVCERPVLTLASDGAASDATPPAQMQKVCDTFNDAMAEDARNIPTAEELGAEAQEQYNDMDPEYREYFMSYLEEYLVNDFHRDGDLLEIMISCYRYWGGAHGGTSYSNVHYDLQTGTFVALDDLTNQPEALRQVLADEIVRQIYAGDELEMYFEDFHDTIEHKTDYNVSFDQQGMVVFFEEYEIAPYVMGTLTYEIPYAKVSRFLNERGQRLLPLTAEDRALGDYYEAEEMWDWFEGLIPADWNDAKLLSVETADGEIEYEYYRIDIPGVTTLEDLSQKLQTRMSREVAQRRIEAYTNGDIPVIREEDGALYVMPAGRGDNFYIQSVDFRAELNADGSGGKVIATIQWQDYDEEKEEWIQTETSEVEFPFVQTENGACFTDFHTIW